MSIRESISLASYKKKTQDAIVKVDNRLSEIQNAVTEGHKDYKTRGERIRGIVVSFIWLAVFFVGILCFGSYTSPILGVIALVATAGVCIVMLVENFYELSTSSAYYTITNRAAVLQSQLQTRRIDLNEKELIFKRIAREGWEFELKPSDSVYDEISELTASIEQAAPGKKLSFDGLKNVLYYAAVLSVAVFGCTALYEPAGMIIESISKLSASSDAVPILLTIGMLIVCIFAIFLAKWALSETVFVENLTLLTILAAPVAFILLVLIATLLVTLVIGLVKVVISIVSTLLVLFIAYSCLCGG